jgi:hypothetical protein
MTDYGLELFAIDKLHEGESADGNNKARSQNFEFSIQPRRAVSNFIGHGRAIASAWGFTGKASDNSGEIYPRAHRWFIQAAKFLKPAEERLACSVGERPFQRWLTDTWSLSD